MYFIAVSDDAYLGTAPKEVSGSIKAFMKRKIWRGTTRTAKLAGNAIALTLMEFGRSEGRSEAKRAARVKQKLERLV